MPHFEVLDPRSAADLLREAQAEVLASSRSDLRAALGRLAVLLGEGTLAEGLNALREDRLRLGAALARHGGEVERLIAAVCAALGVPVGADAEQMRHAAATDPALDQPGLSAAARALARGTDKDAACAQTIADWLAAAPRARAHLVRLRVRLSDQASGNPGSGISSPPSAFPHEAAALRAEQARLSGWVEREKAGGRGRAHLGAAAHRRGGARGLRPAQSARLAALDFDDLIAFTRRLLERPGIAPWVQYKLDQQIDHLMVDEGQDTSPEQWAIIEALCAEFFVGEGARPLPAHAVRGRRREAVDHERAGRRRGELSPVPPAHSRRGRASAGSRGAKSRSAGRSVRPSRSSIWSTRFLPIPRRATAW